ncbi:MAG: hypothetical protein V4507_04165 [Verrucomicrobiota bacterium]
MTKPLHHFAENDPRRYLAHIRTLLETTAQHCRENIPKVPESKAQALLEATAEVLIGLKTAYEHYDEGNEPGMRRSLTSSADKIPFYSREEERPRPLFNRG